ncbi:MAG: diacylglycerol kinase family protein [Cyanobacteria bacterium Co-bin13]|nr:diacylglycerol kinase family protein [Cyanobacteria bacterium Co-bin13]
MSTSREDIQPISQDSLQDLTARVDRTLSLQVASNLLVSFKYAWQGVSYAFRTQRNFRVHVSIGTLAISLAIWLHLSAIELAVISLTCGAVLTMELVNTALESVVDLTVQQTYHELAKIAKDCAAAAVLISALIAVLVATCLLFPPLWAALRA